MTQPKLMIKSFAVEDGEPFALPAGYDILTILERDKDTFTGQHALVLLLAEEDEDDGDDEDPVVAALRQLGDEGASFHITVADPALAARLTDPFHDASVVEVEPTVANLRAIGF